MPQPAVRVVGSGFTTLHYDGRPIAWLESFTDSGQSPARGPSAQAVQAIYELGDLRHPKELVPAYILGPGSINATIRELWDRNVWEHLAGFAGTHSVLDVYEVLRQRSNTVSCQSIIRAPNGRVRGKVFHNCVVTEIPDGDSVDIGSLSVTKQLSITYTHSTPLR